MTTDETIEEVTAWGALGEFAAFAECKRLARSDSKHAYYVEQNRSVRPALFRVVRRAR